MSFVFTLAFIVIIAGAVLAVTSKNILHAVFGLAISLVGIAGLFFTLNSPFVAIMEILIYVGGIAVTMIFAVMLSSVTAPTHTGGALRKASAIVVAGFFCAAGVRIITTADFGTGQALPPEAWGIQAVGHSLLTRFNLAFETLSVVLLLAIMGALVISRKQTSVPGASPIKAKRGKGQR